MGTLPDGVYVDAAYFPDGSGGIGVLHMQYGAVRAFFGRRIWSLLNSEHAEREAVALARRLYPKATIYTDCEKIAREGDASWIPRKYNIKAHRAARRAHETGSFGNSPKKYSKPKKLKRNGVKVTRGCLVNFRGRGVI